MSRLLSENQYITCSFRAFSNLSDRGNCSEGSNARDDWSNVHQMLRTKFEAEKGFLVCKAFGIYHRAYGRCGC